MLKASAILALSTLVGCQLDEPAVGTEVSAISAKDLQKIGYTCEPVSLGTALCKKCIEDFCIYFQCVGGECDRCGTIDGDPPCVGLADAGEQFFFFEAESGTVSAPLARTSNTLGASNGGGIVLPIGATGGVASYSFRVGTPGTFYSWVRVRAPSDAANSLAVRFDTQAIRAWTTPVTGAAWTWVRLEKFGQPLGTSLSAGSHTLRIYGAEPSTYIDRVLVTDNPGFTPVADTYEAEQAAFVAPMVMVSAPPLFGSVGYVWVPNGAGDGGSMRIQTPVPYTGTYYVWGRANAPTGGDNSFYLSASFSTPATWHLPVTSSTGWKWSRATDAATSRPMLVPISGEYGFVQIDRREDGTKLDKIVITNDPGFTPVDTSLQSAPL